MKKLNFLLFMVALAYVATGQPYGHNIYNHPNTYLGSGTITTASPGFLMAGHRPTGPAGLPNFYIDRTDVGGAFNAMPWEFVSDYVIQGAPNCAPPVNAMDCAGVMVIEENNPGSGNYALAGAYSDGAFFATLNAAGVPIAQVMFPFPAGVTSITKPIIVPSSNPLEYFICGSYVITAPGIPRRMYIINVNSAGGIINSGVYHIATGIVFDPRDMIVSPYIANQLVVVGDAYDNTGGLPGFVDQGFFATFDMTTLMNTGCRLWGQPPFTSPGQSDYFNCIIPSSTFGGSYVIGGYSNANAANTCWALCVDPTGSFSNWNNYYDLNIAGGNAIISMTERYSNFWGIYTYYGLVDNTPGNWVTAIKLDDFGNAFTFPGEPNEFNYQSQVAGATISGVKITNLDVAGTDQGIHIYGTENAAAGGGMHLLIEGAYNGYEGCNSIITNMNSSPPGPNNNFTVGVVNLPGLSPCNSFNLVQSNPFNSWSNQCGSVVLPMFGSNNKPGNATGIDVKDNSAKEISFYPNPVNDKLQISFNVVGKYKIQLYNCMGQLVKDFSTTLSGTNGEEKVVELNLSDLGISSGVYFIKTEINGTRLEEKIIYNKQ